MNGYDMGMRISHRASSYFGEGNAAAETGWFC